MTTLQEHLNADPDARGYSGMTPPEVEESLLRLRRAPPRDRLIVDIVRAIDEEVAKRWLISVWREHMTGPARQRLNVAARDELASYAAAANRPFNSADMVHVVRSADRLVADWEHHNLDRMPSREMVRRLGS